MDSYFSSIRCDHNTALAWLMAGQPDKALNALICAEPTAERYYLMAVCEARLNNPAEVISYLQKAVETDKSIREKIFSDAEFLRLFKDPAFNEAFKQ